MFPTYKEDDRYNFQEPNICCRFMCAYGHCIGALGLCHQKQITQAPCVFKMFLIGHPNVCHRDGI